MRKTQHANRQTLIYDQRTSLGASFARPELGFGCGILHGLRGWFGHVTGFEPIEDYVNDL